MTDGLRRGWLAAAVSVSAALVLSAPFMGQIRAALRTALPGQFVAIVGVAVTAAVGGAMLVAFTRIRDRRPRRYTAIAAALALGTGYSLLSATGTPEVDVVERVHFVEYGVITFLFYCAWRPAGDLSAFVLPVLAGLLVGTVEEWLQWFIPNRVGEARDVFLNLVAIGCGLLFSAGIWPPPQLSRRVPPRSRWHLAAASAVVVLVFGSFVSVVHLGYVIEGDDGLTLTSRYSLEQLAALQRDRLERWRASPPLTLRRLSREDQYLDEGLWHVRRRNEAWTAGDFSRAWGENRILETYFAPVLDTATYAGPDGHRWPDAQLADARRRAGPDAPYVSDAAPYPILTWSRSAYWATVLGVVILLGLYGWIMRRRIAATADTHAAAL